MNIRLIIIFTFSSCLTPAYAIKEQPLIDQITTCSAIKEEQSRLACYDAIATTKTTKPLASKEQTPTSTHTITKQSFPHLIADLNETNLQFSYGQLDFLGHDFNSVLLGVGKNQSVKTWQFKSSNPITFSVFGQIRSQFDVSQIDTRNNRGGALINTDFSVGGALVQNLADWSWRFSYTHRSTHLGDEFLIDNPEYIEDRLNLSYETVKWTASRSINSWDVYAGLGLITRSEPGNLGKHMWQAGAQYLGQTPWLNAPYLRPVVGLDLKSWEAADWVINATFRAGIEIQELTDLPFQILFEYQDGHSPYGQFYTEDLSFMGLTFLQNW
ncbi:DUF1207 domain-containing protein [Marinicella rhabdoformis]|uniref:DUF1207 domain-containing protein n=1 Tax=Marinicella rhabdoformis TaxID=2580566 RepID=UPI0012AEC9BD|nr:DUF1207 domain-containing protein [Marinicella rhabdoformis]